MDLRASSPADATELDRSQAAHAVSVRARAKGDQGSMPLADFIAKCKQLVATQSTDL